MGLIKNVQDSNNPELDNKEVPVVRLASPIEVPLPQPEITPQPSVESSQSEQPQYESLLANTETLVPESPTLDSTIFQTPDQFDKAPAFDTSVFEGYDSPGYDPFQIGLENENLRNGLVKASLLNESQLTGSHLPSVYNPPKDSGRSAGQGYIPFNSVANTIEKERERIDRNYSNAPLSKIKPGDVNSLSPNNSFFPKANAEGQEWVNPTQGWLESIFYGLGLLQSAPIGFTADVRNLGYKASDALVSATGISPIVERELNPITSRFSPIANALTLFRGEGYSGSFLWDAIRGRQYSFSRKAGEGGDPVGLRTPETQALGNSIANLVSQIPSSNQSVDPFGIPIEGGSGIASPKETVQQNRDWITDPAYWAGFAVDAFADGTDILVDSVGRIIKKTGLIKTKPIVRTPAIRVEPKPQQQLLLPPGKEYTQIPDPWSTPEVDVKLPTYQRLAQQPQVSKRVIISYPKNYTPPEINFTYPDDPPEINLSRYNNSSIITPAPKTPTPDTPGYEPFGRDKPPQNLPTVEEFNIPELVKPDALVQPDAIDNIGLLKPTTSVTDEFGDAGDFGGTVPKLTNSNISLENVDIPSIDTSTPNINANSFNENLNDFGGTFNSSQLDVANAEPVQIPDLGSIATKTDNVFGDAGDFGGSQPSIVSTSPTTEIPQLTDADGVPGYESFGRERSQSSIPEAVEIPKLEAETTPSVNQITTSVYQLDELNPVDFNAPGYEPFGRNFAPEPEKVNPTASFSYTDAYGNTRKRPTRPGALVPYNQTPGVQEVFYLKPIEVTPQRLLPPANTEVDLPKVDLSVSSFEVINDTPYQQINNNVSISSSLVEPTPVADSIKAIQDFDAKLNDSVLSLNNKPSAKKPTKKTAKPKVKPVEVIKPSPDVTIVNDTIPTTLIDDTGVAVKKKAKPSKTTKIAAANALNNVSLPVVDIQAIEVLDGVPTALAKDLANKKLRVESAKVVPVAESATLLEQQLVRARHELRRLKEIKAPEDRIARQKQVVKKLTDDAMAVYDDIDSTPASAPEVLETPVVEAKVFTGDLTINEFAQVLADGVPGSKTSAASQVKRKLSDIDALFKVLPHPATGQPLLPFDKKNFFRSWSGARSPREFLIKLGVEEPLYYRLAEQMGAPIDQNALAQPTFRVVYDKAKPNQVSKQAVVDNTASFKTKKPSATKSKKLAFDAITEFSTTTERKKAIDKLKSAMNVLDNPDDLADIIGEITRIETLPPPSVVKNPAELKELQQKTLPETMHGTTPEVVKLTEVKLEAEQNLQSVGFEVQQNQVKVEIQKSIVEKQVKELENTADISYNSVELTTSTTPKNVLDSLRSYSKKQKNKNLTPIYQLRKQFPSLSFEDFDSALLQLEQEGFVTLDPITDSLEIGNNIDNLGQGIPTFDGGELFYVSMTKDGLDTKQRIAKVTVTERTTQLKTEKQPVNLVTGITQEQFDLQSKVLDAVNKLNVFVYGRSAKTEIYKLKELLSDIPEKELYSTILTLQKQGNVILDELNYAPAYIDLPNYKEIIKSGIPQAKGKPLFSIIVENPELPKVKTKPQTPTPKVVEKAPPLKQKPLADEIADPYQKRVLDIIEKIDDTENYLELYKIRQALPELSRAELDAILFKLQRNNHIQLSTLLDSTPYKDLPNFSEIYNSGIEQKTGGSLFFVSRTNYNQPTTELTKAINSQPAYHGTRSEVWSPSDKGVGEFGEATYITSSVDDAKNHALKPSKFGQPGTPNINEIVTKYVKPLDANDKLSAELLEEILRGAKATLEPDVYTSFKASLYRLSDKKLKETMGTLSRIYSHMEKFYIKNGLATADVLATKTEVNKRLSKLGYDAIINGKHAAVIKPSAIEVINVHAVPETTALGSLEAKANASSETALLNASKPASVITHKEDALKVNAQILDEQISELNNATKAQTEAIVKLTDTDEQLKLAAKNEQTVKTQKRRQAQAKKAEKFDTKLNKSNNNPCEF